MESSEKHNLSPVPHRGKKWLRSLSSVVAAAIIFTAGVAVGRGDIDISGLSQNRQSASGVAFDYSTIDQIYRVLQEDFDGRLDRSQLLDGLKSGLVGATGDPYTEYFNPKEAKEFGEALSGSFTGIGAELGSDESGNIVIVSPLRGYPAEKAGLKPKDIIAAVDGEITSGKRVNEVVRQIRGPADTKVTLTIVRGNERPFDVTITRAKIQVASVEYQIESKIGYLKISQFTNDTVGLANKAASEFKAAGVKGLVVDLRSNPGGYLDSSVNIAGLWVEKGKTVVSERRGSATLSTKRSVGNAQLKNIPTAVLIDEGSASASEILAGALRDYKIATIVGVKSFGKGSVQQVVKLPDGSEVKVTVARWYTPSGMNIDKQGIEPDIKVEISQPDQDVGRDPQKDKAYDIIRGQI